MAGLINPENLPYHVLIPDQTHLNSWCNYFGCTESELVNALGKIGNCTAEVELFLQKNLRPGKNLDFWTAIMEI